MSELPRGCSLCSKLLCLRQQVINLALGNTETMKCLICLAKSTNQSPEDVLTKTKDYIVRRDCFHQEWLKYENIDFCPDKDNCLPVVCFR